MQVKLCEGGNNFCPACGKYLRKAGCKGSESVLDIESYLARTLNNNLPVAPIFVPLTDSF